MEAAAFYGFFADDLSKILELIEACEKEDHANDKMRIEVQGHHLSALQAFSCRHYEDMERHVHAAMQRLHEQEVSDLKDDHPRTEAKIKLSLIQQRSILNRKALIKLIEVFRGKQCLLKKNRKNS